MWRSMMRVARIVASVALLACGTPVAASERAPLVARVTPAAPAGCDQWAALPTCYVSWYRLLANPEAYRGKVVWLTGYLVSDFGELILYPDRTNYEGGGEAASILLQRPYDVSEDLVDQASSGIYPVVVMGRFSPVVEKIGFDRSRAGGLYDIHKISRTQRVPSGEPFNRRGVRILQSGH